MPSIAGYAAPQIWDRTKRRGPLRPRLCSAPQERCAASGEREKMEPGMSAKRPPLPMTGGCACGRVRYEIASFPLLLYTCNCTDCQTKSGSAFALNMPVATSGFRIVQGEPKAWRHVSPSGVPVISWFCGDCGARLYGERDGRAES